MTKKELPKAYEPKEVEKKWAEFWDKNKLFCANPKSSKPAYSIVMPPPNVTGVLHMGHALVNTLQDVLIRWKRMSGFETLWVPGTDHAGIATQTVVERHLMAKEGKRRFEYSREEFLHHVWEWKEQSQNHILQQIQRLGCSCDWSRLAFTMDEKRNAAVIAMFKKMYDAGLIYRGDYLVNWDPLTQTALADDEVEYEEQDSFLWYIRYPLEEGKGYLVVATTRPETMFGDVAVAVSPKDERYQNLIGKKVALPLTDRKIPILADNFVDPEFGTGAVKITPAHDPNDYEMGLRHNLPMINVMTPEGKFLGMPREEARANTVEKLKALGLIEKIVPHKLRVGVSYRSKAVIEPFLSKQWFVKTTAFKTELRKAVEEKRVKLIPEHWENTYFHWIDHLRDWCISRQLWWGHRIPIWYKGEEMVCSETSPGADWVQDEDVLDTWFSSSLWPFSTMGWPEKTEELSKFYPTSTLITAHDILFFWVARMILMGEYGIKEVPFHETFVHGLIYGKSYWRYQKDGSIAYITGKERQDYDMGAPMAPDIHYKWEKMSKSKGNIIDPIELIETYGTDAVRMALCASTTHARQIDLDRRRFEEFKNFANKIWNGTRYVLMNLEGVSLKEPYFDELLTLEDKWILSLLHRTVANVTRHLESYAFDKAATEAYEFFWKEFCAYYVEMTKPYLFGKVGTEKQKENKQKLLLMILDNMVRLMHPMAPFITEEIYSCLKEGESCAMANFPTPIGKRDLAVEETFAFLDEVLHAVRNIRAEMQIPPGTVTDLIIIGDASLVKNNEALLKSLVKLGTITYTHQTVAMSASAIVGDLKLIIPLPTEMKEKETLRLHKERDKLIAAQNSARTQLANPSFMEKAPPPLVQKIEATLLQTEKELASISEKLSSLL